MMNLSFKKVATSMLEKISFNLKKRLFKEKI